MNVGDKVICIEDYNNVGWLPKNRSVTKGQVYEITDTLIKDRIKVRGNGIDHNGQYCWKFYYPKELFITLQQWREQQLDKIIQ